MPSKYEMEYIAPCNGTTSITSACYQCQQERPARVRAAFLSKEMHDAVEAASREAPAHTRSGPAIAIP